MISIGFYSRQFLVFIGLALLFVATGWTIRHQTGLAAGRPIAVPPGTSTLAVTLTVMDHGRVKIDEAIVPGTIAFLRNSDELRYLLIDQPATFLENLEVNVIFPRPVDQTLAQVSAIINHDLEASWKSDWLSPTELRYRVTNLGPSGSLTLVANLPKGVIVPSLPQKLFGTIKTLPQTIWLSIALVMPLITLLVLGIVLLPHLRHRLNQTGTAIRPVPPENLPPAVVTALVDGHLSARAIAATLLDLASRDYLEIGKNGESFTFTKRRRLLSPDANQDLAPFERVLLSKIFTSRPQTTEEEMRIRIGQRLFSKKVAAVYLEIYEAVTRAGYFVKNPSVVAGGWRLVGLVLFFIGILGFLLGAIFFADPPTPLLFWVGEIIASLVIIALAPSLPAHTTFGLAKRREWLEFRNYLSQKQPIGFSAQNRQEFFNYLPYAVALGVEVDWAQRFVDSPFQLPDWFSPQGTVARWEDFLTGLFPIVNFLARELAAVKEPTVS